MPSVSLSFSGPFFWFSEDTRAEHGIERFRTFEELSRSLIKRICKVAETFYVRLGFRAVRDSYYGDERTIIMERSLEDLL